MVPVSHKSHSVVFHHIHTYDQFGFEKTNRGFVGNGVALIAKDICDIFSIENYTVETVQIRQSVK